MFDDNARLISVYHHTVHFYFVTLFKKSLRNDSKQITEILRKETGLISILKVQNKTDLPSLVQCAAEIPHK